MFGIDRNEPVVVSRGFGEETIPLREVSIHDVVKLSGALWQFAMSPQSLGTVGDSHPFLRRHRWCVAQHVRDCTLLIPLRPNAPFGEPDVEAAEHVTPHQSVLVLDVKLAPELDYA